MLLHHSYDSPSVHLILPNVLSSSLEFCKKAMFDSVLFNLWTSNLYPLLQQLVASYILNFMVCLVKEV